MSQIMTINYPQIVVVLLSFQPAIPDFGVAGFFVCGERKNTMYKTGFYGGKFMPFHRGHLNCILRAASQCEHLYVVLMYNGREELDIIQNQDIRFNKKYLTPHIRELALRKELNDFPNIEVIAYDSKPADDRAEQEGGIHGIMNAKIWST
jgi:cytidyltransferase-like protein